MDSPTLPHLETFVLAAQLSSFTAAAEVLGISQAAVSGRIRALEQDLGVSLFERQAGRARLSDAGRRLCEFAEKILALHAEARAGLTGARPALAGELIIAASSVPGEHLLPRTLALFRTDYPKVQVRLMVDDSKAALLAVEQGRAHLGVVGIRPTGANLEVRPFASDRLCLFVPPGHPWAGRAEIDVDELVTQPLIVREQGSGSRSRFEEALVAAGRAWTDLNIAMELGSNESIKAAVEQGSGAAVLSELAIEREIHAGEFRPLSIARLDLTRSIHLIWDRRRPQTMIAQAFVAFISGRRNHVG